MYEYRHSRSTALSRLRRISAVDILATESAPEGRQHLATAVYSSPVAVYVVLPLTSLVGRAGCEEKDKDDAG